MQSGIPECRKKFFCAIYEEPESGLHKLAEQNYSTILEGHLCVDHAHILLSIPPGIPVSSVTGYMDNKSAMGMADTEAVSKEIVQRKIFENEVIMYQPQERMKRYCASMSEIRKRR